MSVNTNTSDAAIGMLSLRSSPRLTLEASLTPVGRLSGVPSVGGGKQEARTENTPRWFISHPATKLEWVWTVVALKVNKHTATVGC